MNSIFESSIIIPVFNQWDFTKNCLEAIAATTHQESVEVIVVDNASSDLTPTDCPLLGEKLFGKSFRYHRNSENRNFGPASNIGADLASGNFLVFLNNDTVPLEGWYRPLVEDFSVYSDIAATGPILLFPDSEPLGRTVQHMGVAVTPDHNLRHLYHDIPASCPLTKKRRFFQVITGACMMLRKSLLMDTGGFDEHYINGFEDVELCSRLSHKGYRMTVNPSATVMHYGSQT
ncbi:MAG: glycosyltransferase family 2 protein [Desulfovibrio sp.]|jgi:GT2 family glycosyltransferase|nr:glycosyltransferase family 2 protein [Desulfovibrio sp.]